MKKSAFLAVAATLSFVAFTVPGAHAGTLKGSDVSGRLRIIGGNPGGGYQYNSFGGSVDKIGTGAEFEATTNIFQVDNGKKGSKKVTYDIDDYFKANFSKDSLTVQANCNGTPTGACNYNSVPSFEMIFKDPLFAYTIITPDLVPLGYTYQLSGQTLKVFYGGGSDPTAFKLNLFVTPEPAGMLLLGTGLLGVAGMARRRRITA